MNEKRIIYPKPEGGIIVIIPGDQNLIQEISQRDVPENTPYLIIDVDDIPKDRFFRDAWTADFSNPDGYGMGYDKWFSTHNGVNQ